MHDPSLSMAAAFRPVRTMHALSRLASAIFALGGGRGGVGWRALALACGMGTSVAGDSSARCLHRLSGVETLPRP